MDKQNGCSECGKKDTCRSAYEKIGKAEGPNVTWKVILAFLVPIGVFIGVLAGSEQLLRGRFETEEALTLVSFLLAVVITLLVVFVIRAFRRPIKKDTLQGDKCPHDKP